MSVKVYVSGTGAITPIGENIEENLFALKHKKSGISRLTILDTKHKSEYLAAEIKNTNDQLSEKFGLSNCRIPRTALFAIKAASEALENAGLTDCSLDNVGLIGGTNVGGMDQTEKHYLKPDVNPDFLMAHSGGYITELLAEHYNISGYLATLNTACSSSANAIIAGAQLIKTGILDIVLVGGYDSLTKFTLNGFKTLLILSQEACAPFDENRKGLSLGEGAGFIVLESEKSIAERKHKPICELTGYANCNDAFHQTASSPDGVGASLSMNNALKSGNIVPHEINYINVHGTGTENNDLTEGIALKNVFKNKVPSFSSTKPFTGHTLGAAGAIEAVYSTLALKYNLVFPNLNFNNPMKEIGIIPETTLIENRIITHVMSNSFGFGGNDSSIIFSKI